MDTSFESGMSGANEAGKDGDISQAFGLCHATRSSTGSGTRAGPAHGRHLARRRGLGLERLGAASLERAGRRLELAQAAFYDVWRLWLFAAKAVGGSAAEPFPPEGDDPRFAAEAWHRFPFNVMAQGFSRPSLVG